MKIKTKRAWPLTVNEEILHRIKAMEIKEEVKKDISSNFLRIMNIPSINKSAIKLYPSLLNDPEADEPSFETIREGLSTVIGEKP